MNDDYPVLTASGAPIYGRIPRSFLRNPEVSRDARLLWGLIEDYCGKDGQHPWPGQEVLAADMGCSDRQIRTYLNELARNGWLNLIPRPGKSNEHELIWPTPEADFRPLPRKPTSAPPRKPTSGHPGSPLPPKKNQEEEPFEEEVPSHSLQQQQRARGCQAGIAAAGNDGQEELDLRGGAATRSELERRGQQASVSASFDIYWDQDYPKPPPGKSRGPRSNAFKAFPKAAGPQLGDLPAVRSATRHYREARDLAETAVGIPAPLLYASTFLNSRWRDWAEPVESLDDERIQGWLGPMRTEAAQAEDDEDERVLAEMRAKAREQFPDAYSKDF